MARQLPFLVRTKPVNLALKRRAEYATGGDPPNAWSNVISTGAALRIVQSVFAIARKNVALRKQKQERRTLKECEMSYF
jgi:hypothetical protein